MIEDARTATAYGAIARDVDVDATPLEGARAEHQTFSARIRGRKTLGLAAVALAGVGAVARARAPEMFTASIGDAPLVSALGLDDGEYYVRGGAERDRPRRELDGMEDWEISANVPNWCRYDSTEEMVKCRSKCLSAEENTVSAPEVFYIGTQDGYRTISRKGQDGKTYFCYSELERRSRFEMICPTSGDKAVPTTSASLPEGAKFTIEEVPADLRDTRHVAYTVSTLYGFVNKGVEGYASKFKRGMCSDDSVGIRCIEMQDSNDKVRSQFELIPVVRNKQGDVSTCPSQPTTPPPPGTPPTTPPTTPAPPGPTLEDGMYYARGGAGRVPNEGWYGKDDCTREIVWPENMTDWQKSAFTANWCWFGYAATGDNLECKSICRHTEENRNKAHAVIYIGSTQDGYRTISREGRDGKTYVCYSEWSSSNKYIMKCPTSGGKAVSTTSASLPEGAKFTIEEVPANLRNTEGVAYDMSTLTLYTFVNKEVEAESAKRLCTDSGSSLACDEDVKDDNIDNVESQFELIPVVSDASGLISACPYEPCSGSAESA